MSDKSRTMLARQPNSARVDEAEEPAHGTRTAYQRYLEDHLQRMHGEIESTTRKLELEKRRLNKVDEDLSRTRQEHQDKVLKERKPEGGAAGEPIRKLEHRLAKAISQLNHLNHANSDSRGKIDQVRRERLQMNQVFKRLQGDIKTNSVELTRVQQETDNSRKDHDDRLHKMNAWKKQTDIERKHFKGTVHELQGALKASEQEDRGWRAAMIKSDNEVGDGDGTKGSGKTKSLKADEEDNFNSHGVMRRILKLSFLNAIQRRHIRKHQTDIELFEQAFATIKSTTGISDIELIVRIFVVLEQRNYSLLTYVNTLNREIESFEKSNRQLNSQVELQKQIEGESESNRANILSDLKAQIESMRKATEENNTQAQHQTDILERCRPLISAILKTVEKENRGFGGPPPPGDGNGGDSVLTWLTYVEKTLTQWKDFLPEAKDARHYKPANNKNYKYTVGNQVLLMQPKKHGQAPPLVKQIELPSAANVFADQNPAPGRGGPMISRDEDSDTDEDELQGHPWTRTELREWAVNSVAKRRKHRKTELQQPSQSAGDAGRNINDDVGAGGAGAGGDGDKTGELGFDDIIEKQKDAEEESRDSDDSDNDDDMGPTDEEINEIFLKRYKMSREELQGMAEKMGIQLNNLCYLKQEFDAYDEDRSGYIDVKELKDLLGKLGEELSEEELEQAFRELDSDGSGEIEFFEFVEWFTSED